MNKFMSGRFWFTIVAAFVFAWASFTRFLNNEQVITILMLIIGFYFNRTDRTDRTKKGE